MNYASATALRVLVPTVKEGKETNTTLQLADSPVLLAEQYDKLLLGLFREHGHVNEFLSGGSFPRVGREHGLENGPELGKAAIDFGWEMRRVFSDIEEGGESLHVGFEHPGGEERGEG